MNFLGLEIDVRNVPELDRGFIPMHKFNESFLKTARKPVGIALERELGLMASYHTFIHGTPDMHEADCFYIDRLVKFILWMKGGFRLYVSGDKGIYEYLKKIYSVGDKQEFDRDFLAGVYEHPFEVVFADEIPANKDLPRKQGGNWNGCRIGFDAGGSDRKVSAVIDGKTVYSEEVVWFPKIAADPAYHYDGIVAALKSAAAHMPRVDAVGVSSAGIFIDNRTRVASLFLKVPKEEFEQKVVNIYRNAITDTFGQIPYCVANDGDVSALAGAVSLEQPNVLGIAMGTSEAGGFVDANGCVTGWLNELAFAPVDASPDAVIDEWSLDYGVGTKYFSQDAVIKLAPRAGIALDEKHSLAEQLVCVQELMEAGDERARAVFSTIGVYLAHSLVLYHDFYRFAHVLLLGRVMSGSGGDTIVRVCKQVLADEYPEVAGQIAIELPDEKFRRVGQSAVAASLPEVTA